MDASLRAMDALNSPSAAMTLARASRAASASAAMARCSCTGRRTSLLQWPPEHTFYLVIYNAPLVLSRGRQERRHGIVNLPSYYFNCISLFVYYFTKTVPI